MKNATRILSAVVFSMLLMTLAPLSASASVTLGTANTNALSQGLVGYWPLDGATTNWKTGITSDVSGQGNNGSLISMSTTTSPTIGKIGQALQFNGNTQYIDGSSSLLTSVDARDKTISLWINPANYNNGNGLMGLVDKDFDSGSSGGWGFWLNTSGQLAWWVGSGTDVYDTGAVPLRKWSLVTAVWHRNAMTVDFYINGKFSSTQSPGTQDVSSGSAHLNIGNLRSNFGGSGGFNFAGTMDDIRVYNRALSAQEIALLYAVGAAHVDQSNTTSLSRGLIGYWPLDGSAINWKTGRIADISGLGNNGTSVLLSTTTSVVAGKIGQGLKFNGSTQYSLGLSPNTSVSNWTISEWIKPAVLPQLGMSIYNGNDSGGYGFGVGSGAGASGSKLQVLFGSVSWLDPGYTLSANTWYHVVMTRDSSVTHVYVNGVALTTTFANTPGTIVNKFTIGAQLDASNAPYRYLNGIADDARLYNRVLSAQEVAQLYALGNTNAAHSNTVTLSTGLVGYWTFDGGNMNWKTGKAVDSSGNGNDGVLLGMSTTTSITIGKVGQALKLNGSSSYVSPGYTIPAQSSATSFTWSAWMNLKTSGGTGVILGFRTGATWLKLTPSSWEYSGGIIAYAIPTNRWVQITLVKSGSNFTYYANGAVIGTASNATSVISGPFYMGYDPGFPGDGFIAGTLDDVRIYNRALSFQEVQQLYNMSK